MIALLDGDIFCYRVGFTTENEDLPVALWRIDEMIQNCLSEVEASEYRIFLSDSGNNFRSKIYPEYKANRTQPKPRHLQDLRDYLIKEYNAEVAIGMEADDYLGINQTDQTVICSIDKDLLQVPGVHYNFVKKEFDYIDEYQADLNFYKQLLTGDAVDNVKGVPKIGPVKAARALDGYALEKEMFDKVRAMYDNDEYMIMNGQCLWVKRTLDDDWKTRFEELANEPNS